MHCSAILPLCYFFCRLSLISLMLVTSHPSKNPRTSKMRYISDRGRENVQMIKATFTTSVFCSMNTRATMPKTIPSINRTIQFYLFNIILSLPWYIKFFSTIGNEHLSCVDLRSGLPWRYHHCVDELSLQKHGFPLINCQNFAAGSTTNFNSQAVPGTSSSRSGTCRRNYPLRQ